MPQIASKLASQSGLSLDSPSNDSHDLNSLEVEVIDLFVNAVKMLGFPKSVGEIYGLLFISKDALPLDALVERLDISKGSASQGLRLLKSLNAVSSVYVAGDRRDHFKAETQLKKLAAGFIREELEPHILSGEERIERLRLNSSAIREGNVAEDAASASAAADRDSFY
ncbi:MAG: DNA-binding transcriptional regulator GbsR (MarR family), partial [Verrucomicrobiales bacterium]